MPKINNLVNYDIRNYNCFHTVSLNISYDIIIPILSINLAKNENIYESINNIFNKDRVKYITAYKSSTYYNNNLLKKSLIELNKWEAKIAGICEVCIRNNDYKEIISLVEESYVNLYEDIKNKSIYYKDIIKLTCKNEMEYFFKNNNEDIMFIYLLYLKNITVIINNNNLMSLKNRLQSLDEYVNTDYYLEEREVFKQDILDFREKMGLNVYKDNLDLDHLTHYLWDRYVKENNISKSIASPIELYISLCSNFFDVLNIDSDMIEKLIITDEDIDDILLNMFIIVSGEEFAEEEKIMYIIFSMYILAICKEYKKTKDLYLKEYELFTIKNSKIEEKLNLKYRDEISEIIELTKDIILKDYINTIKRLNKDKDDLLIKIKRLNKDKDDLLIKIKRLEQKQSELCKVDKFKRYNNNDLNNKKLLNKIEELKKENKELCKYTYDYEKLKEENIKLRNYVFNENYTNDYKNKYDIDLEVFKGKKIVILGGTTSWVNKMKEQLPTAIFANIDTKYSNLDFIDEDSYVFINTNMKHSFYYKIKSVIKKLNIDYFYIKNYTNIDYSLKDMINILENKNK